MANPAAASRYSSARRKPEHLGNTQPMGIQAGGDGDQTRNRPCHNTVCAAERHQGAPHRGQRPAGPVPAPNFRPSPAGSPGPVGRQPPALAGLPSRASSTRSAAANAQPRQGLRGSTLPGAHKIGGAALEACLTRNARPESGPPDPDAAWSSTPPPSSAEDDRAPRTADSAAVTDQFRRFTR